MHTSLILLDIISEKPNYFIYLKKNIFGFCRSIHKTVIWYLHIFLVNTFYVYRRNSFVFLRKYILTFFFVFCFRTDYFIRVWKKIARGWVNSEWPKKFCATRVHLPIFLGRFLSGTHSSQLISMGRKNAPCLRSGNKKKSVCKKRKFSSIFLFLYAGFFNTVKSFRLQSEFQNLPRHHGTRCYRNMVPYFISQMFSRKTVILFGGP